MNRKKNKFILTLGILFALSLNIAYAQNKESIISVGLKRNIYSEHLKENRSLFIHLPKNYENNNENYPVLFLLDGDFLPLFLEAIAATGYLHLFENTQEFIIVGIHTNVNRDRDLVPSNQDTDTENRNVKNFMKFLTGELKPFIEKEYRTSNYNILFGASNGGLFAIYTLFNKPDCFDAIISSSPSIGHCPDLLKTNIQLFLNSKYHKNKVIYFNYGKADNAYTKDYLPQFFAYFKEKLSSDYPIRLDYIESQGHVPFGSVYEGLKYIFKQNRY